VSQAHGRKTDGGLLANLTPTKYQEEFLRGDKRYLAFVSGVGAGKTYAGIIRTILNMEHWNQGDMGAIVAPTRQMIVNVIIPEMRELGLLDKWEYNSSYSDEPGLHSPNGSRALILSADNSKTIERLRGLNLAWGWIDERTAVPERAKEILSQRLRTGSYRNLYETTTPKGKDSVYDFYVGDVQDKPGFEERPFDEATVHETDDRLAIVGVPTRANEHTPEDYKDAMEQDMPDEIRAQEVEGQFVEIGSGVLTQDMIHSVQPDDLPERQFRYVVGVDLGVTEDSAKADAQDSDYWSVALLAVDPLHAKGYIIDIRRKRGMSLRQGLEWLSSICDPIPNPDVAIESNQSQRWFAQEARDMGLQVTQVHNTDKKEHRLIQLSIPFENETVRLVDHGDNRFDEFKSEWIAWPDGSHDDQLDSVEIAVNFADLWGAGSIIGGDLYGNVADSKPSGSVRIPSDHAVGGVQRGL